MTPVRTLVLASLAVLAAASVTACKPAATNTENAAPAANAPSGNEMTNEMSNAAPSNAAPSGNAASNSPS